MTTWARFADAQPGEHIEFPVYSMASGRTERMHYLTIEMPEGPGAEFVRAADESCRLVQIGIDSGPIKYLLTGYLSGAWEAKNAPGEIPAVEAMFVGLGPAQKFKVAYVAVE
jgi:hypothetical protein